ncbi:MAG: SDR family NAD(P)-dependent oxidoreductase, partial [Planctomycetes bacterium]|nr:SDR family NAD(P)-dependent oxidoreductase [Planctomycetota bacterium]
MPSAPFDLAGKVALVTGSSKGLGRARAMALAAAGAKGCMNYYNDTAAAGRALQGLNDSGGECIMVRASAIDEGGVDELIGACEDQLGPVDVVVVNATCDQPHLPIEE